MMGKRTLYIIRLLAGIIATVTICSAATIIKSATNPRQAGYDFSRLLLKEGTNLKTITLPQYETKHFVIRYYPGSINSVQLVASAAESMYIPVTTTLGTEPEGKTMIVVYPDSESLAKSFGWDRDERAMGVYWGGTIRILNPQEWINSPDIRTTFFKEGPMVHEFTHLIIDNMTRGNYPRWFTEGVAQYMDKKINGFSFTDPFQDRPASLYDFNNLEKNFDQLDQGIVYWQSLKAAELIVNKYGEDALFEIIDYLGQGKSMDVAFKEATGETFYHFTQELYNLVLEENAIN
ncbi:MAG: peptidase MA family metallohydrolase [Chitinophagales bacterium]